MKTIQCLLDSVQPLILVLQFCLKAHPQSIFGLVAPYNTQIVIMSSRFKVVFSSWDYDLSSCIVGLLKEVERSRSPLPIVDVLFNFLSKRVD